MSVAGKLTDFLAARTDASSSCSLSKLLSASSACSCSDLIFFFTASRYAVPAITDYTDCLNGYHRTWLRSGEASRSMVHSQSGGNALPNTGSQFIYTVLSHFKLPLWPQYLFINYKRNVIDFRVLWQEWILTIKDTIKNVIKKSM